MSTPSHPPESPLPTAKAPEGEAEIKIISHSNLFYWWPVWAVGFLMFLLTFIDGHRMAVVPADSHAHRALEVSVDAAGTKEPREVIVLPKPKDAKHAKQLPPEDKDEPDPPTLHMAKTGTYGVIFLITLLLVIVITNVPLRGMWSVVVIVTLILLSIILGLAHYGGRSWWEIIIEKLSYLDIRINAAGYFFVSSILFVVWLVTFLFFDQQMYIIFTRGQLKVRTEIGGGEKAYDTAGMTVEKQRSDLFRHWILGLGSGDLLVNTVGAHVEHIPLPNVLFIGKKVQQIEDMLRERAVVKGR
jgi:hypothetical protein